MANDTTYGLAATAWTTNLGRAHRLAKRLQAGTVSLNCQLVFDHDVPFGGYKHPAGPRVRPRGRRCLHADEVGLGAALRRAPSWGPA